MSYTCPICSRASNNPYDEWMGYCGACHSRTRDCLCEWRAPGDGADKRWHLVVPAIDCPEHGARSTP